MTNLHIEKLFADGIVPSAAYLSYILYGGKVKKGLRL